MQITYSLLFYLQFLILSYLALVQVIATSIRWDMTMLLALYIGFFIKSMDRNVTPSGGKMYQPQLLRPI